VGNTRSFRDTFENNVDNTKAYHDTLKNSVGSPGSFRDTLEHDVGSTKVYRDAPNDNVDNTKCHRDTPESNLDNTEAYRDTLKNSVGDTNVCHDNLKKCTDTLENIRPAVAAKPRHHFLCSNFDKDICYSDCAFKLWEFETGRNHLDITFDTMAQLTRSFGGPIPVSIAHKKSWFSFDDFEFAVDCWIALKVLAERGDCLLMPSRVLEASG